MKSENKSKEEIIKLLKKEKIVSTLRFIGLLNISYNRLRKLLTELKEEGLIKQVKNAFWSLK